MNGGTGFEASRYHLGVVDDEEAVLGVLLLVLEPSGYQSCLCNTSAEALEQIRVGAVDLLLSDFHMPEMDGLGLIQECRPADWRGPVAIMSGRLHSVPQQTLKELGVSAFLEKPFPPMLLSEILRNMLSKA